MHVRYLQHHNQGTVQLLLVPLSSSSIHNTDWADDDDEADCDAVPLPIQTFLWRQTNPFLGAKIGKLHEASCVTLERVVVQNILHGLSPSLSDAIASVSRWKLVRAALPHVMQCCGSLLESMDGQRGLSTSLQKILYILHWMLLDSAVECMENATNREDNGRGPALFSISSIQLFVYLIAPLADVVSENDISNNIRLESGLKIWQALWQYRQPDVWCFSAPVKQRKDELPMVTYVRRHTTVQSPPNQGIYLGDDEAKPRRPSIVPPPKPPRTDQRVLNEKIRREEEKKKSQTKSDDVPIAALATSTAQQLPASVLPMEPPHSFPTGLQTTSIVRSVSEYKTSELAQEAQSKIAKSTTTNAFDISPSSESSYRIDDMDNAMKFAEDNHSLSGMFSTDIAPLVQLNDICSGISVEPASTSSTEQISVQTAIMVEEDRTIICELCGQPVVLRTSGVVCDCSTKKQKTSDAPPVILTRASTTEDTVSSFSQHTVIPVSPQHSPSPVPRPSVASITVPAITASVNATPTSQKVTPSVSRDKSLGSSDDDVEEFVQSDPTVATYLDVAVIRALLITHWQEQGVFWAMRYLLNRLEEIQAYAAARVGTRQRSNSLPSGERKPEIGLDIAYQNPTWDDFQLFSKEDEAKEGKLHVAFNDVRRKSSEQALVPERGRQSRRASLNTLAKKERNKSDPSLNNSIEVLSIKDDSGSMSNISSKSAEKATDKITAHYYPEALGSSNFIEKDGRICMTVVVQTINQVMERCNGVRLCELALNIADTLLRTPSDRSENFFAHLSMMIFRIYLALGCPHGCNDGVKSQQGDFLRVKSKTLLASLERLQQEKFKQILTTYVDDNSPQQVLDLLHSITAFCRSEFAGSGDARRPSEPRAPSYRNRFNEREKGVEGRIINATCKSLTTKLAAMSDQLQLPENMSLLQDVRMLVTYMQDQHGNPFRRVGLSALIDALIKNTAIQSSERVERTPPADRTRPSTALGSAPGREGRLHLTVPHISLSFEGRKRVPRRKKPSSDLSRRDLDSGKNSPGGLSAHMARNDQASLRRGLFKKRERSNADDSDADSSPSTPRTVSSMDDSISPLVSAATLKKKSAPKLHFAFNLLKTVRTENMEEEGSDSEVADDNESDFFASKRSSRESIRRMQGKSPIDIRGNLRLWGLTVPAPRLVDVKAVFEGARRFAFLLETARPGTFPDPPLIAALLHLKSAVLARAALLLECAHFVSRCNRGQWPEWIRSNHHRTLSLGGPLANRGTPSATRRMHTLQRMAGRYFYQWAVQIGEQLSKQIDMAEATDRKELKMGDTLEDFMDDVLVNDASGENCPPALQLIAVMLLQEITAFLRETFRTIPRAKNPKAAPSSGWEKLLSHRRWSILSNTFNQQQMGSITSIADINSSIHLNDRERRISLSTAEEDSPRGSKDTIDEIVVDKKVRPPSLSARLFSRQSTHEESGSSAPGSTKSTTYVPDASGSFGRRIATGRQRLLKRGSPIGQQPSLESSNKRRSFRMRKQSKLPHNEEIEEKTEERALGARDSLKPTDELPAQSPTEPIAHIVPSSHPSSQQGSGFGQPPVKSTLDDDEQHMLTNLPWIKVVIRVANSFDLSCTHEGTCTPRCFSRVHRQSHRLSEALASLYGKRTNVKTRVDRRKLLLEKWNTEQQTLRRSSQQSSKEKEKEKEKEKTKKSVHSRQSSAVPRRESAMVGTNTEGASKAIKAILMEKMLLEKEKEKEKEKEESIHKKASVEQDRQSESTIDEPEEGVNKPMLDYIRTMVLNLVHAPLSTVLKSCLLLTPDQYKQMIDTSWQLLLNPDPHVVLSAASMFILTCVRRPEESIAMVKSSLESKNASDRTAAIQRFYALWRNRYHVWAKMEDGAQTVFKVPPPSVDFTQPSPVIGQRELNVVDPPWMPHLKTKIEELSLKEEEHATSQTIMTMTRTRRKQKQEMVKRAVREAEERQCEQRQQFRLRGSAIMNLAAYEPVLFIKEEAGEGESDSAHHTNRHNFPLSIANTLFPSSLLAIVPTLIEMLDDPHVDKNGVSVGDVAKKVIWMGLVEEPVLFLRHFMERLTNRDRQTLSTDFKSSDSYEYLMSILRKLILRFNPLPSAAAHTLLNALFGFVMHYVRAQCEGADKALGIALSLTWILAPNVHGLYFKDLKQTLKKEQCDQALMITANVPSAKKIIVHGPDSGMGGIPSQFPVHEDTQFQQILSDSLEFFNIEDADVSCYFLTDSKTGVIHMPSSYVRDFYFFHRSFYPQLTLVKMNLEEAHNRMRQSCFAQRFIELGKVLLTHNILKYSPQNVIAQRVFFLHEELTHLPSFPRKSLETSFGMPTGEGAEQLRAMEAMHKFTWAKLMSDIFEKMENSIFFPDLHLFINVVNGIMIMHCEDVLILRRCAAIYITMSIHFNQQLFSNTFQGFFLIIPTLLRCYSQRQTNRVFCSVVEFLCRQFYTLHRKPFVLQMCGAVATILDNNDNDFEINPMRVKAKYWFNLLKQMESEKSEEDQFDILGLVPYEKPLKAIDLCYRDDPNTFCILTDVIASCICVCACSPESRRSHHMLLVMQALLPHLIKRIEEETTSKNNSPVEVKHEISQWTTLCVEMKALINSCEALARGPQRTFDIGSSVTERGKSFVADSPQFFDPPTTNDDENNRPYHLKEKRSTATGWEAADVEEQHKELYRRPRDTLLCLAAQFLARATPRLKELSKMTLASEHTKIPEVMDHKCHVKLSEIAQALLKIAPYDLTTMSCLGLQKYFMTVLPVTEWSVESNRSSLNNILRRLDKTISKIAKKQSIRRRVNWGALSNWIVGICDTLTAFPYMAHLHPLKTTTQLCLRIMVGDPCHEENAPGALLYPTTVLHPTTPPIQFCHSVLRLSTILMQALGQFSFSLEYVSSVEGIGPSADRIEAVLCHLLVPLFLRASSNPKEATVFQAKDLSYCLTLMHNAISPPLGKPSVAPLMSTSTLATTFIRGTQAHDLSGRQGSVSVTDRGHSATVSTHRIVRESVCQSIYLALKVLMLGFGKLLSTMWPRVAKLVKDLLAKKPGAQSAIAFVEFLLNADLPITMLVLPIIHNKVKQKPSCDQDAAWQAEILDKIENGTHQTLSVSVLLSRCHTELIQLREELSMKPMESTRSYTPTMTDAHSDSSAASLAPRTAASRQSIDRRASTHAKKAMMPTMKEGTEGTIPEDVEDEGAEASVPTTSRVIKSPSVPLNKIGASPRTRSIGGFGMWRSVRRKSRHISSTESESEGERSVELHDVPIFSKDHKESRSSLRRSTEALVLPLHETLDTNRQRFVSFSTPKKTGREEDDEFHITEQHQLV